VNVWTSIYHVVLSDVNECDTASTCTDIQTCTNTPGSYTCNCKAGYRMTGDTCNGKYLIFFIKMLLEDNTFIRN